MTSLPISRKKLIVKAAQAARSIAEGDSEEPRLQVAAAFLSTVFKTNFLSPSPASILTRSSALIVARKRTRNVFFVAKTARKKRGSYGTSDVLFKTADCTT